MKAYRSAYSAHPTRCQMCGGSVDLIENAAVFGQAHGSGKAYRCRRCGAYSATEPVEPYEAIGILADDELRWLRNQFYAAFDPFWTFSKCATKDRSRAYERLAKEMGIEQQDCKPRHFDKLTLLKALHTVSQWVPTWK